jgi:adenylyltransferase/sulfurtransferase
MATTVFIPTPLRAFTDQQATVQVSGATVGEVLQNLVTVHSDLKNHLYTPEGKLRSFVNVYLNDEDIRYLGKEQTPVGEKDSVSIVPSVAGGAPEAAEGTGGAAWS